MNFADIHCHILPYVDDGALVFEVTKELLEDMFRQGVRYICCTPHLRKGMFETPDDEVIRQFERVRQYAAERYGAQLQLFLSREYHFDQLFREKLTKGEILPLGGNGYYSFSSIALGAPRRILLEFSRRHTPEDLEEAVRLTTTHGYSPVIAHVERYSKAVCDPKEIRKLADLGARIQLNASAVIGRGGFSENAVCKKLLKEGLAHVVASDAHDPEDRPSEMEKAAQHLTKKYGTSQAEALLYKNPLRMLGIGQ